PHAPIHRTEVHPRFDVLDLHTKPRRASHFGHHLGSGNECFTRHTVGEHSRPADTVTVHQGHLGAELSGHECRLVSARTSAEDRHPSHICHQVKPTWPVSWQPAVPVVARYGQVMT